MSTTILAVDLGKYNSVFCWYDPDARVAAFRTTRTTPEEVRREFLRQPVARVVFEACSQAGWVHDLCGDLALPALVASTTRAARQWRHVRRKTDRDDALQLARLAAVGEVEGVPVPPRAMRQRKSLIGLRKRLVAERSAARTASAGCSSGRGCRPRPARRRGPDTGSSRSGG